MLSWLTGILTSAFLLSTAVVEAAIEDRTRLGNYTIDRTLQLRTHSLYAPYIDQDLQNRWWDFGADAYVNTAKHVRLTQNLPSQMGWLWSRFAITSHNFVIEVEFKITGGTSHLYGDGLAMWLTSERAEPGPVFGNRDQFTGLGILLDTYSNGRHTYSFPRVVGVLGDGKMQYDYGNDGDEQAIGGCSAEFRRTNVITKLKVTYIKTGFLDVKIQYKAWDDWMDCFHIDNVVLPPAPFIGFSAMTGDVSDSHDIITITSYSAVLSEPESHRTKGRQGHYTSERGTWLGFIFKLFLLAGVLVGGYYGWQEYKRRQRYDGDLGGAAIGGGAYGMRTPGVNDAFGVYNPRRF